MLDTLRVRGYDLFCNAIVTSDLQLDLFLGQNDTANRRSFTFFAPIDSSLFALDMTQTASSYTDTLRFHVVPRRLSISDLLRLPVGSSLPTLLPHRFLKVTQSPDLSSVAVGGVEVAFPGLFYGRDIAVHGLAGIISLRSNLVVASYQEPAVSPVRAPAVSPVRVSYRQSFPPRTGPTSSAPVMAPSARPAVSPPARPVVPPIAKLNTFNVSKHGGSPPPVEVMPPVNREAHAPVRESAAANSQSYIAASPFNLPVHPPQPDVSDSPVYPAIHAPKGSRSSASATTTPGISPAGPTESPADINVLSPLISHAFTPTYESAEYRRSSISAPPLGYSDAEVPVALGPNAWTQKKHGATLLETFTAGSEGLAETVRFNDKAQELSQPLMDAQEKRLYMRGVHGKSEPLDGVTSCVDPDGWMGLQHSPHPYAQCRYAVSEN